MNLQNIIDKLNLLSLTKLEDHDAQGVFISDMLSDVMTCANSGDVWLTVQTHTNIVAVANLVDAAAVVITHGKKVPDKTIELAIRYHVNILSTPKSTFEIASKLNELGLKNP